MKIFTWSCNSLQFSSDLSYLGGFKWSLFLISVQWKFGWVILLVCSFYYAGITSWLCLGSSAFFLRYLFGLAWFSQTTSCFPFHVIVFVFFSPADPRWVIHIHIYIKNIKMVLILKKMVVLLMSINLYFIVKYRRTKYLFLIFFHGFFWWHWGRIFCLFSFSLSMWQLQ